MPRDFLSVAFAGKLVGDGKEGGKGVEARKSIIGVGLMKRRVKELKETVYKDRKEKSQTPPTTTLSSYHGVSG